MKKNKQVSLSLKKSKVANLTILNSIKGGTGDTTDCGDPGTDTDSRKDDCDNDPGAVPTFSCKKCPPEITLTCLGC